MLKKFSIILVSILLMLGMCGSVKATNDAYDIKKAVTSYEQYTSDVGGEIVINISNITLNNGSSYKYKLQYGEMETQWYNISSIDTEKKTLNFTLEKSKPDILAVLKITDSAHLTIQEISADSTTKNIIENKAIDISLPLSKAFKVGHWSSGYHGIAHTYDIEDIYYKYVKVENEEILKKYLEYLKGYDKNDDTYWGYYMDDLIDKLNIEEEIPKTGWEKLTGKNTSTQPTEEGLYFIWMKAPQTTENKELIGCVFSKRFSNISVLEKQLDEVQEKNKELTATVTYSPTSQTTGSVTATIKTNKKVNKVNGWTLSDDKITLTKVYYSNATEIVHLVDEYGMTKDIEIKVANITKENQNSNEVNNKDETMATGSLPQTGVSMTITISLIAIILVAIVMYKKYNNYKDIK